MCKYDNFKSNLSNTGLGFGLGYVYHFGFCLVFAIIDWSNRPGFITRYKIQPSVAEEDSHLRFKRAIKVFIILDTILNSYPS